MTINLLDYPMDMEIFVNFPKCKETWVSKDNKSGCLLTSFWASLGFDLRKETNSSGSLTQKGLILFSSLYYATKLLISSLDSKVKERTGLVDISKIYDAYDNG